MTLFAVTLTLCWLALAAAAQDTQAEAGDAAAADSAKPELSVAYPIAVSGGSDAVFVVDLDLPGVWRLQDGDRSLWIRGSDKIRQPLYRPRCIARSPDGGIFVGDSATREVYFIADKSTEPKALSGARIGIPMAIAVDPDGAMLYVGDAEKRAVLRLPTAGGEPELVARINARGLDFDEQGRLLAVTPDDPAIVRIDLESDQVESIVTGRPFGYANGLAWDGEAGYVTDNYQRCVWKFTADGNTERWSEREPLIGPVGIDTDDSGVLVTDPKAQQVFRINRDSKKIEPLL